MAKSPPRGVSNKETAVEIAANKNKEDVLPESMDDLDFQEFLGYFLDLVLFKLITTGTCDPKKIRSKKVSLLFFSVPAKLVMWILGICSTVGFIIMAGFHMGSTIVFYEVIPWILGFILSFSIVVGMIMKQSDLLLPFRLCLAFARIGIILGGLLLNVYIFLGFFDVYFDPPSLSAISEVNQLKRFKNAVMLIPIGLFFYCVIGIMASAATRVSYYFKKAQRG